MNTPLAKKASLLAAQFRTLRAGARGPRADAARAVLEKKSAPIFAKKGDAGELYVYEQIGENWYGDGLTAKRVKDALAELGAVKTLNIFINSEGGDVFEAKAILTNLRRHSSEKVVHIDGLAASAATLIAMAGDKIITSPVATWMVHEAWTIALGRAEDMRATADLLDLENTTIAETYAAQTGSTVEEMLALMEAETWMNAQTALDKGFTDEISKGEDDEESEDVDASSSTASPVAKLAAATLERLRGEGQGYTLAEKMALRSKLSSQMKNRRASPAQPREPASR